MPEGVPARGWVGGWRSHHAMAPVATEFYAPQGSRPSTSTWQKIKNRKVTAPEMYYHLRVLRRAAAEFRRELKELRKATEQGGMGKEPEGTTQATTFAFDAGAPAFVPLGLEVDWPSLVFTPNWEEREVAAYGADGQEQQDAAPHDGGGYVPAMSDADDDEEMKADTDVARGDAHVATNAAEAGTNDAYESAHGGVEFAADVNKAHGGARRHQGGADSPGPHDAAPRSRRRTRERGRGDGRVGALNEVEATDRDNTLSEVETGAGDGGPLDYTPLRQDAGPGTYVVVMGLKRRQDLNMRAGVTTAPMTTDGRFAVCVFSGGKEEEVSVHLRNLLYISPTKVQALLDKAGEGDLSG